jgi:hypothetical protein
MKIEFEPAIRIRKSKFDRLLREAKKNEREMVLEAVRLVLKLYPHKHSHELFAEIVEYLNRKVLND